MSHQLYVVRFAREHIKTIGLFIIAIIVTLTLAVVVVRAAIPDSNTDVISACVGTGFFNKGQVSVIDNSSQSCAGNQSLLKINSATSGQYIKDLRGADFSGSDLRYQNFNGADLTDVYIAGTNLTGTTFIGANLTNVTFGSYTAFTPLQTAKGYSGEANFTNANFTDAYIESSAHASIFTNANFTNTHLVNASFTDSDLSGVDFRQAILSDSINNLAVTFGAGTNLTNTNFKNLTLTKVTISGAIVTNANFRNVHFVNANLQVTNFSSAILTSATWVNTICPDNTNSDTNGNTCIGHLVP